MRGMLGMDKLFPTGFWATVIMLVIFCVAFGSPVAQAGEISLGLVAELDKNEIYHGHLVAGEHVWVGHIRNSPDEPYRLQAYSEQDSSLVAELDLPHSLSFLQALGEDRFVAVGRSADPWLTHYSVIRTDQGRPVVSTYTFPERYQVERVINMGERLFFTEPGSRAVYELEGRTSLRPLPFEISAPGSMATQDGQLWIVERRSFGAGDESLLRYDTVSGEYQRYFANKPRQGLTEILSLEGYSLIAVSETLAGQVLLLDSRSGDLVGQLSVGDEPYGLAQVGSCLVAVGQASKTLTFISLAGDRPEIFAQWDISSAGDRLKQPRMISISADFGKVFVRSAYPCPSCTSTQSAVFFAKEADNETINACIGSR